MTIAAFVKLCVLFVARTGSAEAYYRFQEFQARLLLGALIQRLDLKPGDAVCDFGCGRGGYAHVLADYFGRVDAVDFYVEPSHSSAGRVSYYACDLLAFRAAAPDDCIICASVIEHIPAARRQEFISAIAANLRPGGKLYLNFPPYLSLIGGHKVAPFHYLPDRLAFALARICKRVAIRSYATMYDTWGLHTTYIGDVRQLLEENNFTILDISSRFMPRWYVKMFRYNNFFNWNAEFFAEKKQ